MAANRLFKAQCHIAVLNPAYTKHYAKSLGIRTQTDQVDANVLARYGREYEVDVILWQPPPLEYAELDVLTRRKHTSEPTCNVNTTALRNNRSVIVIFKPLNPFNG